MHYEQTHNNQSIISNQSSRGLPAAVINARNKSMNELRQEENTVA